MTLIFYSFAIKNLSCYNHKYVINHCIVPTHLATSIPLPDRAEPHRAGPGVRLRPGGRPGGHDHQRHQAQVKRLPRRERRVEGGRGEC